MLGIDVGKGLLAHQEDRRSQHYALCVEYLPGPNCAVRYEYIAVFDAILPMHNHRLVVDCRYVVPGYSRYTLGYQPRRP